MLSPSEGRCAGLAKFGFPAKSVADPHVVPPLPEPELLPEELPLEPPELDPDPEPAGYVHAGLDREGHRAAWLRRGAIRRS